jgi:hypothetical protein
MAVADTLTLYNLALGFVGSIALMYLLYIERFVVGNRRFLLVTTFGILLFIGFAPLMAVLAPAYVHVVHGFAAVFVILGLYDPVTNDLRKDDWARLLFRDPSDSRHPADWMVPLDDDILVLFHRKDLVLTPAIVAYNLDRSREEVNRRLSELADCGLVERVERGKYRITGVGVEYLDGASEWTCIRDSNEGQLAGPQDSDVNV